MEEDLLRNAFRRLGEFGKLFLDYKGCPRGALGRAFLPIEEEVLQMSPIIDVDGGEWIPVHAGALHQLVEEYKLLKKRSEHREAERADGELREDGKEVSYE